MLISKMQYIPDYTATVKSYAKLLKISKKDYDTAIEE